MKGEGVTSLAETRSRRLHCNESTNRISQGVKEQAKVSQKRVLLTKDTNKRFWKKETHGQWHVGRECCMKPVACLGVSTCR